MSRPTPTPAGRSAALGALIAARRAQVGVHVIECQPGQFDVVLRLQGPFTDSGAAHRSARWLTDAITALLGPIGQRNPRPPLIRPRSAPPRKAT